MHGRHETPVTRQYRRMTVVLTTVLVVTIATLATSQWRETADGQSRTQLIGSSGAPAVTVPSLRAQPANPTGEAAAARKTVEDALSACRLANLRQQTAVAAAAVSLGQWDKHIDAMNLLVAGKISLPVAREFWERTRVAAQENVTAFQAADANLTEGAAACPVDNAPINAAATPKEIGSLGTCQHAIALRSVTLAEGRRGIAQWQHHIHEMEMLRDGTISADQAAKAWLKSWQAGNEQMRRYQAAAARSAAAACPLN